MDYFSYLPEAVILIIISFLPFRDAVRTSMLSRRWRHFWHAARNIDLDEKFFVRHGDSDENIALQRMEYMHFIHHWMGTFREPEVRRFRVVCSSIAPGSAYVSDMQRCVVFVAGKCLKPIALDLDFSSPSWDVQNLDQNPQTIIQLPFIEAHATLESLQLSACRFDFLQCNNFDALKNVHLGWIEVPGYNLNKFITMCPSLETLSLKRCWNVRDMIISAQRLKILVIDKCMEPESITVDAPLLTTFKYYGLSTYMRMDYHKNMEEAVFDYGLQSEVADEGDGEMLYNLLLEIFSVRVLTICSYMLQVLPMCEEPLSLQPKLENMRHLILKTQLHINEYYGISFFLNSCPRLEILEIDLAPKRILDYGPPFGYEEHPFLIHEQHQIIYQCMKRTLKTVKVKGFKGTTDEMVVLRYLLKFGFVLENLFVDFSKEKGANDVDMEATYRGNLQRLIQLGTASPCLQVYTHHQDN
ncbi:F-box protein At3g62230-like [Primulina tabacum]|uniref:F-box protein At3g62230-like n=1 Tax=Primulina tabacum TaxID=48773 RepID=UPI003F5A8E81